MLVVILGTHASGSTWVYNAAREICSAAALSVATASTEHVTDLLDQLPDSVDVVLVKAHAAERRFLRLMSLSGALVIVTRRDARDSVVSQNHRFALNVRDATTSLSRAFASITMLPASLRRLSLSYEDRFFDDPEMITTIADFLGVRLLADTGRAIFDNLRPERVMQSIREWVRGGPGREFGYDPVTQWHSVHLGNGRSGKWLTDLPADTAVGVMESIPELRPRPLWGDRPFTWSSEFFHYDDAGPSGAGRRIACDGSDRHLVYGPYLHLPVGRWRVVPTLVSLSDRPVRLKVDVFQANTCPPVLAEADIVLTASANRTLIDFRIHDHFQPVEIRISAHQGQHDSFQFDGVELGWLGD